jgi:hypothetical protein
MRPYGNWSDLGQHVLEIDLGYHDSPNPSYDLDEVTKKRLLVHARHDAATAAIGITDTYDKAEVAATRSTLALVFAFVAMCSSIATLATIVMSSN